MHTSFCSIAFQRHKWGKAVVVETPLREILPILAEAGYDGVEIWQPHIAGLDARELASLAAMLRTLNLAVPMLSPYFDFTTSNDSAQSSLALARQCLDQARALGATAIRVFTGKVGSAEATPEQWDRAAGCLRELADASASAGVCWALELHSRNLTDTVAATARLLTLVDRPNVHVIAHSPAQLSALTDLPGKVRHIHANNARDGQKATPSEGEADYRQVLAQLHEAGFTGYVSVEWMGDQPAEVARKEGAFLRDLLRD